MLVLYTGPSYRVPGRQPMEPSERYEKLFESAIQDSKSFYELQARCKDTARAVSALLAQYLGMPSGTATVVELHDVDGNLRAKGEGRPIGSDINLLLCNDELWYFGLGLHFEKPSVRHFGAITLS